MKNKIFIIGTGGHAKVVADCILSQGDKIAGFIDDNRDVGEIFYGCPVVAKLKGIRQIQFDQEDLFIIALGNNRDRMQIAENYPELAYATVIHKSAQISPTAQIGTGTVIMPLAVVNAQSRIGRHCIVNSAGIVEHDNMIGDYVHISPNAAVGGKVQIGNLTHIGIGAAIKNNVSICGGVIIGAGSVVVKNIEKEGTYVGAPARQISGDSPV